VTVTLPPEIVVVEQDARRGTLPSFAVTGMDHGFLRVRISCPGDDAAPCTGVLRLLGPGDTPLARRVAFRVARDSSGVAALRLTTAMRRRLGRGGKVKAALTAEVDRGPLVRRVRRNLTLG
jgi:hypothetical protein